MPPSPNVRARIIEVCPMHLYMDNPSESTDYVLWRIRFIADPTSDVDPGTPCGRALEVGHFVHSDCSLTRSTCISSKWALLVVATA